MRTQRKREKERDRDRQGERGRHTADKLSLSLYVYREKEKEHLCWPEKYESAAQAASWGFKPGFHSEKDWGEMRVVPKPIQN